MDVSNLSAFIALLRTDDALRQEIFAIETASAQKISESLVKVNEKQDEAILHLAKKAGFDLSSELKRPGTDAAIPAGKEFEHMRCPFTCCYVKTSTLTRY